MKTLELEGRGCNFWSGDDIAESSDVGNYRVCTFGKLKMKDGREMFLEFTQADHWKVRYQNKRTGARLKHPVTETIIRHGLFANTEYERPEKCGNREYMASFRDLNMERAIHEMHLPYTRESILRVVNMYAVEQFDRVEIK